MTPDIQFGALALAWFFVLLVIVWVVSEVLIARMEKRRRLEDLERAP